LAIAVAALAWPRRETIAGAFAVGVTGCAAAYVLTFFLVGVAADFRYGYWCVLADLIGTAAAAVAFIEGRRKQLAQRRSSRAEPFTTLARPDPA
jgi:predicted membrane protein